MKLQAYLLSTLGAVLAMSLGCNAGAGGGELSGGSSALLVPPSDRGVLECRATKAVTVPGTNYPNRFASIVSFWNDNDQETVSIDRVVVWSRTGVSLCPDVAAPIILGPHQTWAVSLGSLPPYSWCIPEAQGVGVGYFTFMVYWSRPWVEATRGALWHNPPIGEVHIAISKADTGELITRVHEECKALFALP